MCYEVHCTCKLHMMFANITKMTLSIDEDNPNGEKILTDRRTKFDKTLSCTDYLHYLF